MLTASYREDVVEEKNEFENLYQTEMEPSTRETFEKVLKAIMSAKKLLSLNKDAMVEIIGTLMDFYKCAYDWEPELDVSDLLMRAGRGGYLPRTQIRAAVECLDQLYHYGTAGGTSAGELNKGGYEEDLPELAEGV